MFSALCKTLLWWSFISCFYTLVKGSVRFSGFDEKRLQQIDGRLNLYQYRFYHYENLYLNCWDVDLNVGASRSIIWSYNSYLPFRNQTIYSTGAKLSIVFEHWCSNKTLTCTLRNGNTNERNLVEIKLLWDITRSIYRKFTFFGFDLSRLTATDPELGQFFKYNYCKEEQLNLSCNKLDINEMSELVWRNADKFTVISASNNTKTAWIQLKLLERNSGDTLDCEQYDKYDRNHVYGYIQIQMSHDCTGDDSRRFLDKEKEIIEGTYCKPKADGEVINKFACANKDYFYITGLPEDLEPTGNSTECTSTLVYKRPMNINLTCHFFQAANMYKPIKWYYRGTSQYETSLSKCKITSLPYAFNITENDNNREITCQVEQKGGSAKNREKFRLKITLLYTPEATTAATPKKGSGSSSEEDQTTDLHVLPIAKNITNKFPPTQQSDPQESFASSTDFFREQKWVSFVLAGIACLIVLFALICVLRRYFKGSREAEKKGDVTYENLSNEPSHQFPPNLDTIYARPHDTLKRDASPYASTDGVYAVPYVENDKGNLYAKVIPKNERENKLYSKVLPKDQRIKQNDSLMYATLDLAGNNKTAAKKDDPVYSEVLVGPAGVKNEGYGNVFNGDAYVNAKNSEYAEPAYCELNRR